MHERLNGGGLRTVLVLDVSLECFDADFFHYLQYRRHFRDTLSPEEKAGEHAHLLIQNIVQLNWHRERRRISEIQNDWGASIITSQLSKDE
jgi:hypothetical protein